MCCCLPSGSPSPSPRRRKSETRRPSETQVVRARSAVHPASSQEEPIVSKYARAGASGIREDVLIEELKDLRLQLQEERQKNTRLMGKLTNTAIDCCTVLIAPSVCASIPVLPLLCVHASLYCPICVCVCVHPCLSIQTGLFQGEKQCVFPCVLREWVIPFLPGGCSSVKRICCSVIGMGSTCWLRAHPSV